MPHDDHMDADHRWSTRGWKQSAGDGTWRVPGIPNLHSHAFQRAMAGLAERQTDPADSFWTWRETMYRMAARFDPESLHAVAAQLYVEMLEAGYTTVCEFHYLHHAPDGTPYADPAAMSQALIAAARDTGIRMTLLPVLYMTGGFDGRPLVERQRRFGHDVDAYLRLSETLRAQQDDDLARRLRPAQPARGPGAGDAPKWSPRCRATRACTSTSPNRSAKCRTASPSAVRGRSNGCSATWQSTRAGRWCTRRT